MRAVITAWQVVHCSQADVCDPGTGISAALLARQALVACLPRSSAPTGSLLLERRQALIAEPGIASATCGGCRAARHYCCGLSKAERGQLPQRA